MADDGASTTPAAVSYACPIPASHDKFEEAHYFLHRMLAEYHEPEPFRWNLNAFLQALRSITLMLQKELSSRDGFEEWYKPHQDAMRADPLLRTFHDGRNIVVHQGVLSQRSKLTAGIFRGREMKVASERELDINRPTAEVLKAVAPAWIGSFIDAEHSAVDEQIGVERQWILDELDHPGQDVISACHTAWARIGAIVVAAHRWVGADFNTPGEADAASHLQLDRRVLLESDIDPDLPRRWGWID
jgi:hypothetical protein